MLDRPIYILPQGSAPQRTVFVTKEVNEKRAPTDDSVRLLREMEAKALSEIVQAVRLNDPNLDAVVHLMQSPSTEELLAKAIIRIGGRNVTADCRVSYRSSPQELYEALVRAVSDKIADELVRRPLIEACAKLDIGHARPSDRAEGH